MTPLATEAAAYAATIAIICALIGAVRSGGTWPYAGVALLAIPAVFVSAAAYGYGECGPYALLANSAAAPMSAAIFFKKRGRG